MAKVSTNISIDKDLKKEAQALFKDLGMDLSTAISIFLMQAVREQAIPFEVTREIPNRKTIKALNETEEMINDPKKYKRYNSLEEMLKDMKIKY